MNLFSKNDWYRMARQTFRGMIVALCTSVYENIRVLVEEAQELTRKDSEDKLDFQLRKMKYVMRKFIATHDEIREWDDTLSDVMNAAIRDLKGRDILPNKLKIPKWLKIDIN